MKRFMILSVLLANAILTATTSAKSYDAWVGNDGGSDKAGEIIGIDNYNELENYSGSYVFKTVSHDTSSNRNPWQYSLNDLPKKTRLYRGSNKMPRITAQGGGSSIMIPLLRANPSFSFQDSVASNGVLRKLVTNYGALGQVDDTGAFSDNFNYDGINKLFDGTIIIGNGSANLAMDVYNHNQTATIPDTNLVKTNFADSIITFTAYLDNANLGVRVVQNTKTFMDPDKAGFVLYRLDITNISDSLIPDLGVAIFCDWDVGTYFNNQGGMDTTLKLFYQYDDASPAKRFGILSLPSASPVFGYQLLDNEIYLYPTSDLEDDSVWAIMSRTDFNTEGSGAPTDYSMLLTLSLGNLSSGQTRTKEFALFGYDTTLISSSELANLIQGECAAIPGDINASGGITLGDVVHLLNYLFDRDKPPCIGIDPGNCWDFGLICRGDVNNSSSITLGDIVHLLNYLFDRDNPPCIGLDPGNCWTPEASGACCVPVP